MNDLLGFGIVVLGLVALGKLTRRSHRTQRSRWYYRDRNNVTFTFETQDDYDKFMAARTASRKKYK